MFLLLLGAVILLVGIPLAHPLTFTTMTVSQGVLKRKCLRADPSCHQTNRIRSL